MVQRAGSANWRKLCIKVCCGERRNALSARTQRASVRCRRASEKLERAAAWRPEPICEKRLVLEMSEKSMRIEWAARQTLPQRGAATSWLCESASGESGAPEGSSAMHADYPLYVIR